MLRHCLLYQYKIPTVLPGFTELNIGITFASASKLNLPKIVRHEQNKLWAKPILGQSEEKSIVYVSFVCIIYTLQAVVLQSRPRLAYSDRFLALLRKIYSVFFFHTLRFAQMRNVLFTS